MYDKSREETTYDQIRAQLVAQVEGSGIPEDLRVFLTDDWARLMTEIFLGKGNQHPDWEAGWETLNLLLWSLSPRQGREETLQMLRLLPPMLSRLHEACAALGYDPARRDSLLSTLAMLHAAVASAGLQADGNGGETAAWLDLGADRRPADDGLAELRQMPAGGRELPDHAANATLLALKVGDWLEFQQPDGTKRLRLDWISPQQGMYLFANEQGLDTLTLTRLRLAGRLNAGEVRVIGQW